MPIREYRCPKCGCTIELLQKNGEGAPMCFNDGCEIEMKQIMSLTNFKLNGVRWARDGYGGNKK